jgi:hypothetical protein
MNGDSGEPFLAAFRGSFTSALRWHQLDALWERVRERADAGWYIYAVGEPPAASATAARLSKTRRIWTSISPWTSSIVSGTNGI